jgi:hypothetical protein
MKPHLLHRDADFQADAKPPAHGDDLVADLELNRLIEAMASGNAHLGEIARVVLLHPLAEPADMIYRQQILADCLAAPDIAQQLYDLATDTLALERDIFRGWFAQRPEPLLHRSVRVLEMLNLKLRTLRDLVDQHVGRVASPGLTELFATVRRELGDDYLAEVDRRLRQLRFPAGMLLAARLGDQNESTDLVLLDLQEHRRAFFARAVVKTPSFSVTIPSRDDAAFQSLAELTDRSLDTVANAAAQSADHVLSFFTALRNELAFYLGCVALHRKLTERNVALCLPDPRPLSEPRRSVHGLVDPCLALAAAEPVVGNDLAAETQQLVIITGANRGGKSTFLRSLGVAQLMMQCGMFVAAEEFIGSVRAGVYTHFRREEDRELRSGKLDEELRRMQRIARSLTPGALLLFNESFAATNEAEGSEIAREVTLALVEAGATVCYVTHLYDFAHSIFERGYPPAVFLRAQRASNGDRAYRLVPAEPLPTSYGVDVYRRVFGASTGTAAP